MSPLFTNKSHWLQFAYLLLFIVGAVTLFGSLTALMSLSGLEATIGTRWYFYVVQTIGSFIVYLAPALLFSYCATKKWFTYSEADKIAPPKLVGYILILSLLILPFVFKGKIVEIAKNEVNKTMNAKIDFSRLSLNFIKSFPHASVTLKDFYVAGIDEFEGDTLVFIKNLSATVNIKSFFGDAGYEISKISVDDAKVHAIVLENGKANWDIMPIDSTQNANEPSNFELLLPPLTLGHRIEPLALFVSP